jgi:hypothetical protein
MENHIIRKEDGTIMKWDKSKNNTFCLLYSDNKQKYYFTPSQDLKCSVFMIGGGGAGGYYFGGGGGAGAAYINDNFIFKKNTSYSFEIGVGGKCEIDNINNLFQEGLSLRVFNNTTPKLDNFKFSGNDYSSIGITSAGIIQSYITENINIPNTIFNNNTTYIWDGYIKPKNNNIRITVNSKIKVMIWVDKTVFDNNSAIVNGVNVNDVKILQLDSNKYFNVKIIAYNFDTANTNFNINFEDCDLFNFNKSGEVYNYTQASDTNIIYRTSDDKSYIIKCKGGGNGGCGLYNQNQHLDGGCGGGSGINKKNGKAIVDPSFNGNDGAVGANYGGGGGIISAGNDSKGGKGKIIEWFNDNLIFGAGGNGASIKDDRHLGYGCGGNGAECCKISKSDINNNGNNGCILISFKNITENFANFDRKIQSGKDTTYYDNSSIVNKLIEESFSIFNYAGNIIPGSLSRSDYFDTVGQNFNKLCYNDYTSAVSTGVGSTADIAIKGGNNNMNNFIYDMIVASKLFGVIYRLYYYEFKITHKSDIVSFSEFVKNAKIKFTDQDQSPDTSVNQNIVNLANIFKITDLKLNIDNINYRDIYCGNTSSIKMTNTSVYTDMIDDIGNIEVPNYHRTATYNDSNNTAIKGLKQWYEENYDTNKKFINIIEPHFTQNWDDYVINNAIIIRNVCDGTLSHYNSYIKADMNTCSNSASVQLPLHHIQDNKLLDKERLEKIYNANVGVLKAAIKEQDYSHQRILFHLENFNIILNTDPSIILNILKYYMYYYNAVVYNVILQYDLFKLQQLRIKNFRGEIKTNPVSGSPAVVYDSTSADANGASPVNGYVVATITEDATLVGGNYNNPNTYVTITRDDIVNFTYNIDKITEGINTSSKYIDMIKNINNNTSNIKDISKIFDEYQTKFNKVVNIYNNDLDIYKSINNYYKGVIVVSIIIIILAIFLFTIPNIDGNSQTGILLITVIIMILFYVFYLVNLKITEPFINCRYKGVTASLTRYGGDFDFTNYKSKLSTYNVFLLILASGFTVTGETLTPMNDFVNQANNMRRHRILYYKNKIAQYSNASELLKKDADNYYYLMTLIYFSIIIALSSMAFYLLFPSMLFTIMTFAILIFLVLLIFIVYRINRTTRLFNDKKYWANFNPSNELLEEL